MNTTKLIDRLLSIEEEKKKITSEINEIRSRRMFLCGCGKYHAIKDCTLIQTHWYVPPRGCSDGDYWNDGEVNIICPITDSKNRILFDNKSLEEKFKSIYKPLFKNILKDYKDDKRKWWNNYYFEKNSKRFEIEING